MKKVFSTNHVRTGKTYAEKLNLDLYLTPYTKINWRCIIDQSIKGKTIGLLRKSTREYIHNLGQGKDYLGNKKY